MDKMLRALPDVQFTTKGWELFSPMSMLILNQLKPDLYAAPPLR